jgi:hypothetical protein
MHVNSIWSLQPPSYFGASQSCDFRAALDQLATAFNISYKDVRHDQLIRELQLFGPASFFIRVWDEMDHACETGVSFEERKRCRDRCLDLIRRMSETIRKEAGTGTYLREAM